MPMIEGDPRPHIDVTLEENKVPNNLKNTPRGVNPKKRPGFYANENPLELSKALGSAVPESAVFPTREIFPREAYVDWHSDEPPQGGGDNDAAEGQKGAAHTVLRFDHLKIAVGRTVFWSAQGDGNYSGEFVFEGEEVVLKDTFPNLVLGVEKGGIFLTSDNINTNTNPWESICLWSDEETIITKLPAEYVEGTLNLDFAQEDVGKVLGVVDYGYGEFGIDLVEKDDVVQPIVLYYDKTETKQGAYGNSALTSFLNWSAALDIKNAYEKGRPIFLCPGGLQSNLYKKFAVTYVYHNHYNSYDILGIGAVVALDGENNTTKYEFKVFDVYNDH